MTTPRATRQFRAMGCRSSVVVEAVDGDAERLAELTMIRIARLEASWSRFLPDSDISRINAAGGAPVAVRAATVTLLLAMAEATRVTDGAYDPTVLHPGTRSNTPCRWLERVSIDATACVVRADGVQLDPGGIGKGLGADLVVDAAVADGASAAVVSLGGDVRLAAPAGSRHVVEIAAPRGDAVLDRIVVADGAVATSGLRRGDLVDPANGSSCSAPPGAASCRRACWRAPGRRRKRSPKRCSSGARRCSAVSTRRASASSRSAATGRWRATSVAPPAPRSSRGRAMNEQVWWYLARAAGMLAAILMVGALVLGVLAATRALKEIDRPAWLVALHRWFSVLTAIAVVTHLLALVADSYLRFGLVELLVPFTSSWRPLAVTLGVVALYLFAVVHISSLAMKRLSKLWWRRLHTLSYVSVWAAVMHAGTAGTDTANVVYRGVALVLTMAAVRRRAVARDPRSLRVRGRQRHAPALAAPPRLDVQFCLIVNYRTWVTSWRW